MSRKWERMVERNKKAANLQRRKLGQTPIAEGDKPDLFLGRSWIVPLILEMFAVFFMILFKNYYTADSSYWFTVICYFLLGVFIFFVRRPVLSVAKSRIATRRITGEKAVNADEIDNIALSPNQIVITLKHKNRKWVFSSSLHLFKIKPMADRLRKFAAVNQVSIQENP